MSASVTTFPQTDMLPSAPIVTGVDRRAATAAERTGPNDKEIERLPFDLSVLEEEGLFVNVDATGFGILDRRLDWQALGVELPGETDVAFRPPRCGLLPNRYRRPLLTPVSQAHSALHKYSYHFRLTEMKALKQRGQHVTLYTGYTLEELISRHDARVEEVLALTDIMIDGPFVKELSENAGEWLGSINQRVVHSPSVITRNIVSSIKSRDRAKKS